MGSSLRSTASSLGPAPTVTAPAEQALGPDGLPTASPLTSVQEQFADLHAQDDFIDAAVIEAGQAVCDRVSYLAHVDDQALGEAISAGALDLADTAIPMLCPDLLPSLHGPDSPTGQWVVSRRRSGDRIGDQRRRRVVRLRRLAPGGGLRPSVASANRDGLCRALAV